MGRSATRRAAAFAACLLLVGCSVSTGGTGSATTSGAQSDTSAATGGTEPKSMNAGGDAHDAHEMPDDGDEDAAPPPTPDELVRLHELQLKGTLDSYHVAPGISFDSSTSFSHVAIGRQLGEQHVRALHLVLHQSGSDLEVYNRAVVDAGTLCQKLDDCLAAVRAWSDAHRGHLPLLVKLDVRDTAISDASVLDEAIAAVFEPARLLTPTLLTGEHESPRAALEAEGWPTLADVRGKVLFVLAGPPELLAAYTSSVDTMHSMFAVADDTQYDAPWAAVTSIADPMQGAEIRMALNAGMLVLSEVCSAATTDETCSARRDAALANGAHVLFDAFPAKVEGREYWLDMAGDAPARCNPVTATTECEHVTIEPQPARAK